jgi:heme-degrading monooxygenase HmoA
MIARIWRARARTADVAKYEAHFRSEVLHNLVKISGFRGAELLTRTENGFVEILVETRWDSMDSVRKFAGSDPDHAVVEPEARAVLMEFDSRVRHFDVVASA